MKRRLENRVQGEAGKWIRLRMGILCGILSLGMGLVVSAGWDLMIKNGDDWRDLAEQQRQRRLKVRPKRGIFYDRNGSALAVSVEVPAVSLDAKDLLNDAAPAEVAGIAREAASRISFALGVDAAQIEHKILAKRRWTWLRRQASPEQIEAIRLLSQGAEGVPRIRGLIVEGEPKRFYPRRELAAPLLGFVSPDGKGRDGLEYSLNEELEGHADQLRGLRDRSGRLIFSEGIDDERAFAGHNVQLTIDQGIQFAAERALVDAVKTFEASGGSVVVIEPNTGEILAMASYPGFNPNDYGASSSDDRRNRAVNDTFEPGSTMKIFTVAAGLEAKTLKSTEELFCEDGVMRVDNVTIRDTHASGWLPVSQILAQSSNICAAKIGLSLGEEKLYESFRRFGFGQRTGAPLPGESPGNLRPRARPWVQVETASASFGQGISVTNIQLALATAAIANGGELMEARLIREVTTADGEIVRRGAPRVRRRVVSEKVARQLAEMLVAVTEEGGTGGEAQVAGFRVAGKTATAQKTDSRTGRYSLNNYVASFSGFVPARDPEVAIAVTIDEPRVEHAGGSVAAPVFSRVAEMVLRYKGITPEDTKTVDLKDLGQRADPARATQELISAARGEMPMVQEIKATGVVKDGHVRLPNLTGAPMRSVLRQLSDAGVVAVLKGSGLLLSQSPPPGAVVAKGTSVELVFRPAS